jgi:hypothetical protein
MAKPDTIGFGPPPADEETDNKDICSTNQHNNEKSVEA